MELRHIRYFIAVAEESSLGRAARRLRVSQPALGEQINHLEIELGFELFTRSSRGVQLTEAGRIFLNGARRVLATAKLAAEQAQEAAQGDRGRLMIGSIPGAAVSFMPEALARFRQQHPLVETTVLLANNREQVEGVLNGSIMLGIGYYLFALQEDEAEQVCTRFVRRSRVGIVCPKNWRFLRPGAVRLADFRHDKFLALDPKYSFGYEQWLRNLCRQLGSFQPDIAAVANSADSLAGMVAAGRGIYVGAELGILAREQVWGPVSDYYPLTEPESHIDWFAIWKKAARVQPAISNFIDILVAE
ncbi:MAG: LysR family transcriptional regulator [Verrucomicrobia bacterium]|nr:LysR family transcriptional regulator [Verrucomicrobiota bacterium]